MSLEFGRLFFYFHLITLNKHYSENFYQTNWNCNLAKHLTKLLSSLTTLEYIIPNTEHLVDFLEQQKLSDDCEFISFDVTSLFTSVPLYHTIDVILQKIYEEKLVYINIPRQEKSCLLLLCTKNVHFTFKGKCYQELGGGAAAISLSLGRVITGIFMVELEKTIVQSWT